MRKINKAAAIVLSIAIILVLASCEENNDAQTDDNVYEVGKIIKFGEYKWRVLDVQDGDVLIVSESVLEMRAYHEDRADMTWEDCSLRQYLNDEFYNSFSEADKARIIETAIVNSDNLDHGTPGGNSTTDKIFLLSIYELNRYFKDNAALIAANLDDQAKWWWLRSPGGSSYNAAGVGIDGVIYYHGNDVHINNGIRPAMWITTGSGNTELETTTVKIGRAVQFGDHEWLVLDARGNEALIISLGLAESLAYHADYVEITWEDCSLRQYLNDEFYNSFSEADKARIIEKTIVNSYNPLGDTPGGNDTTDRIFLLSIDEAKQYFSNNRLRLAFVKSDEINWWWLRSPGGAADFAAFVASDGDIYDSGTTVYREVGVRPAMWITF